MFIKPKAGLKVRDPVTLQHIPEGGKEVPETSYWIRALASGDVFVVSQTPDSTFSVNRPEVEQ